MRIAFQPLATVVPQHPYYAGGCRDIEFVPTSATADLLRAGRSIARMRDGALHLLYELDDAPDTPVSSLAGRTLYFGMRLGNPYFVNFTTPVIPETGLTPLYANGAQPTALDAPVGVTLAGGMHAHTAASAARPLAIVLRSGGHALETLTLQTDQDTAGFDLRKLSPGPYRIDEEDAGISVQQHRLLVDPDLRDYGVWGVLALTIDAGFYADPPQLDMVFSPRQETLRYYVVASNFPQAEFEQLTVNDQGDINPKIVFNRQLTPFPQGYLDPALLGDAGSRIAVFESQTQVARSERGRRKLKLSRNSTVLIEHLPLPGPEKVKADLIVHLSKP